MTFVGTAERNLGDSTKTKETTPDPNRTEPTRPEPNRTEQKRTKQNRTEKNRAEQNITEHNPLVPTQRTPSFEFLWRKKNEGLPRLAPEAFPRLVFCAAYRNGSSTGTGIMRLRPHQGTKRKRRANNLFGVSLDVFPGRTRLPKARTGAKTEVERRVNNVLNAFGGLRGAPQSSKGI
jgi:hypothetical protein